MTGTDTGTENSHDTTAPVAVKRGRPARVGARNIEQAILAAAAEQFMQHGFAASMEGVASAARVSKRTLYERYPSKPKLFEAVLVWISGDLVRPVALLDPKLPVADELLRFSFALFDLYTQPRVSVFLQMMLGQANQFPDIEILHRKHFNDNILLPLRDYLETALGDRLRDVSTTSAATIMCSVVTSELTRIFAERDEFNRDRFETYVRSATEILLHGIVRPE